jgi:putative membrane protein
MRSKLKPIAGLIAVIFLIMGGTPAARGQTRGSTNVDQKFADRVLKDWMLEVALAKEAVAKTTDPDVQRFATGVLQDPARLDDQLTQIAQKEGLSLPLEMGSANEKKFDQISRLNGPNFDRAYMRFVVQDHMRKIAEFTDEAQIEENPAMGAFASQMAPQFKERLSKAESINKKLAAQKYPWWQFWEKV